MDSSTGRKQHLCYPASPPSSGATSIRQYPPRCRSSPIVVVYFVLTFTKPANLVILPTPIFFSIETAGSQDGRPVYKYVIRTSFKTYRFLIMLYRLKFPDEDRVVYVDGNSAPPGQATLVSVFIRCSCTHAESLTALKVLTRPSRGGDEETFFVEDALDN